MPKRHSKTVDKQGKRWKWDLKKTHTSAPINGVAAKTEDNHSLSAISDHRVKPCSVVLDRNEVVQYFSQRNLTDTSLPHQDEQNSKVDEERSETSQQIPNCETQIKVSADKNSKNNLGCEITFENVAMPYSIKEEPLDITDTIIIKSENIDLEDGSSQNKYETITDQDSDIDNNLCIALENSTEDTPECEMNLVASRSVNPSINLTEDTVDTNLSMKMNIIRNRNLKHLRGKGNSRAMRITGHSKVSQNYLLKVDRNLGRKKSQALVTETIKSSCSSFQHFKLTPDCKRNVSTKSVSNSTIPPINNKPAALTNTQQCNLTNSAQLDEPEIIGMSKNLKLKTIHSKFQKIAPKKSSSCETVNEDSNTILSKPNESSKSAIKNRVNFRNRELEREIKQAPMKSVNLSNQVKSKVLEDNLKSSTQYCLQVVENIESHEKSPIDTQTLPFVNSKETFGHVIHQEIENNDDISFEHVTKDCSEHCSPEINQESSESQVPANIQENNDKTTNSLQNNEPIHSMNQSTSMGCSPVKIPATNTTNNSHLLMEPNPLDKSGPTLVDNDPFSVLPCIKTATGYHQVHMIKAPNNSNSQKNGIPSLSLIPCIKTNNGYLPLNKFQLLQNPIKNYHIQPLNNYIQETRQVHSQSSSLPSQILSNLESRESQMSMSCSNFSSLPSNNKLLKSTNKSPNLNTASHILNKYPKIAPKKMNSKIIPTHTTQNIKTTTVTESNPDICHSNSSDSCITIDSSPNCSDDETNLEIDPKDSTPSNDFAYSMKRKLVNLASNINKHPSTHKQDESPNIESNCSHNIPEFNRPTQSSSSNSLKTTSKSVVPNLNSNVLPISSIHYIGLQYNQVLVDDTSQSQNDIENNCSVSFNNESVINILPSINLNREQVQNEDPNQQSDVVVVDKSTISHDDDAISTVANELGLSDTTLALINSVKLFSENSELNFESENIPSQSTNECTETTESSSNSNSYLKKVLLNLNEGSKILINPFKRPYVEKQLDFQERSSTSTSPHILETLLNQIKPDSANNCQYSNCLPEQGSSTNLEIADRSNSDSKKIYLPLNVIQNLNDHINNCHLKPYNYTFLSKHYQVDKLDNIILNKQCFECFTNFDKVFHTFYHFVQTHGLSKKTSFYKCSYCQYFTYTFLSLFEHLVKAHDIDDVDETNPNYQCQVCKAFLIKFLKSSGKKKSTCKFVFANFILIYHFELNSFEESTEFFTIKVNKKIDPKENYTCRLCFARFKCKSNLDNHLDFHINSVFKQCQFCKINAINLDDFIGHAIIFHRKDQCIKENYRISLDNFDAEKISTNYSSTGFKCISCDTPDLKYCSYETHCMVKHTTTIIKTLYSSPLTCPICHVCFEDETFFIAHCTSSNITNICYHCCLPFKTDIELDSHIQTHTHVPLIRCKLCACKFNNIQQVTDHIKEKHFKKLIFCITCETDVPWENTFLDDSHFKNCFYGLISQCLVCGQKFTVENVRNHLIGEIRNFNYQCNICYNYFCSKQNLTWHINKIHCSKQLL